MIACLTLYFAVPILSLLLGGQHLACYGRVWLFNVLWILFWPVLLPFMLP